MSTRESLLKTVRQVPGRAPPPVTYLNVGGAEHYWLSYGSAPYVFGLRNLVDTMGQSLGSVPGQSTILTLGAPAHVWTGYWGSSELPATSESQEEFIQRHDLEGYIEYVRDLARRIIGPATAVETRLRTDRESGRQQLVIEVKYSPDERSRGRLQDFMAEYTAGVPPSVQREITLLRLPA